jgi:hypothetical protein
MQRWCPLAGGANIDMRGPERWAVDFPVTLRHVRIWQQLGGAPAATDDGKSCEQACQAVFGERRTAALAETNLLPVQRPHPGGNESHNSVTGLPVP